MSECDPSFAAGELDDEGCEPTDFEWDVIAPLLPNKPRGVPRVDHWRVLNCISGCCAPARHGILAALKNRKGFFDGG